jgi:serine phosphatase RsbU (regulator of sigma subunit)
MAGIGTPDRAGFAVPAGGEALSQLARVTSELGAAEDMDGVVAAAVTHVAGAIRAATATLMVLRDDQLVMVGGHGLRPGTDQSWGSFPLEHDNPASEAARLGKPIMLPDPASVVARYPSLNGWMPPGRSLINLALGAGTPPVGVIGLTFEDSWLPGPNELDLLTTFADACGQSIRRVQANEQAKAAAETLRFFVRVSAELASSVDYRARLSRLARLTVPMLADWCTVQIVEGGALNTLAVAHVDPAKVEWARNLEQRYPADPNATSGAPNVVRTGVSELYEAITDEMLTAGAQDEEHLRLSRELDLRSAIVAPLVARHRTFGAITLIRAGSRPPYTKADLAVAEELGRRAALSLDNARLHSEAHGIALQLQQAVLPDALGDLTGWEIATHYESAGPGEVGGDFYDAVALPEGGLAVFIGDIMGRGIEAAAAMAQLRAAVRAYLCLDPHPELVVARLDAMNQQLGITRLATLLYARIDPARGVMQLTSAGHLPALIVAADGATRWARPTIQPPLGVDCPKRMVTELAFGADEIALLYTDGLVERRDKDIDECLDRLAASAHVMASARLADGLAALVKEVGAGEPGRDDVTAIAVRRAE